MNSQVLPPNEENIARAAQALRAGELVAFPTETVYGLGANALDTKAVQKIFLAKGRPSDNPLIVHIASYQMLDALVTEIPGDTVKLMQALWPGPLTLVFPKSAAVPSVITAGGETVAIRWPSHQVAQDLIRSAGIPIAAPSANLSGKPSPTTAEHVLEDLHGKVESILDGGPTEIGVESTVLDVTGKNPVLLRAGGVSTQEIECILGKRVLQKNDASKVARSPGMKYRHYAPQAKVRIFTGNVPEPDSALKNALVTLDALEDTRFPLRSHFSGSEQRMAREIFGLLRELDKQQVDVVYIQAVEPTGLGQAIMDRLNRAAEG